MTLSRRRAAGLIGMTALFPALPARATIGPISLNSEGVAIKGYDPTSYWQDTGPRRGSHEIEELYAGAPWRFASDRSRDTFRASPARFVPMFGGYCAEGLARGFKRASHWNVYVLIEDQLFMHYSIEAQNRWAEDVQVNIDLAKNNWDSLRDI